MISTLAINPIWITLGPIVVINAVLFVSYIFYRFHGRKTLAREFKGAKKSGSSFLSSGTREWWFWTTDPLVRLFVKLHIGPNVITAMGFSFAALAGLLFSRGWFGYAGWAMIGGASFDIFDGRVARITGKVSRSGAFFDAVMDRFSEGICFLGLAVYFRDSAMLGVVIAALIGSLLVSYARARAEGVGIECTVGIMQRPERIAYLGVASVLDPIMNMVLHRWWAVPPPVLVILALILIAVMTNGTAIYRMVYVMNALDTADKRGRESIPQIITRLSTSEGREALWEKARYGYDRTKSPLAHVVLFLLDGISPETVSDLAKAGDLPNISRYILERGGSAEATSAFPSATGPATAPFVTGCFPGTCDIPGVRWFDRSVPSSRVLTMNRFRDYAGWGAYAMDHDLSKSVRTIFEYSRQAVNIFGVPNRGCGLVRDPAFFRMRSRFYRPRREEDIADAEEAAFSWFQAAMHRETDFVLYSFPPLGLPSNQGASADKLKERARKADEHVGRAAKLLQETGIYERTALLFSGAHGRRELERRFDLGGFLSKRHKTVFSVRGLKEWHDSDVIALASGTSMAHIYVRAGDWADRSFFEDIERRGLVGSLLEQDGVDILAGRSIEGGIVVQTRQGRAHILEDADGRITYLIKGGDPFEFPPLPQVLDAKGAFAATAETKHPDAILQLLQIFRSRRTGDLVLSAEGGVSLISHPKGATGLTRGSLCREHMLVPFMASVAPGAAKIRTADVFAITLELLGIEPAHAMDGATPRNQQLISLSLEGRGSGRG
ncbi:MAG: alkaline phosphatase family protein [Pseudomonadota bacterium]